MGRAAFQVLIIPFKKTENEVLYCIFRRKDMDCWQWIAGGGENEETPIDAAKRESFEEADVNMTENFIKLKTITSIPSYCFKDFKNSDIFVIPEYAFAVEVKESNIKIFEEHLEYKWVNYEMAEKMLKYDGNKTALWELKNIIEKNMI